MRFNLPRRLVLATLAAALLTAPLPASAASRDFGSMFESSWGSIVGWTGAVLRHLWAEKGGSIDPAAQPAGTVPAAADGRHLWAEEGASCDPLGRPAACASGLTLEDNGR